MDHNLSFEGRLEGTFNFSPSQEIALNECMNEWIAQQSVDIASNTELFIDNNSYSEMDRKYISGQEHSQSLLVQQQNVNYNAALNVIPNEDYNGPFNFQVEVNQRGESKNFVYSKKLAKSFIIVDTPLPLHFKCDQSVGNLYLRAIMVYKNDQFRGTPVQRCPNHQAKDHNIYPMTCSIAAASYEPLDNGHLSIRIRLPPPEAGVNYVPIDFKFGCKNSCSSGMNRRATEVIFMLENEDRDTLGRRSLEVRVCSCPKRDKEKEEALEEPQNKCPKGKRRMTVSNTIMTKKPKSNSLPDAQSFHLPLNILGVENCKTVLKVAHDGMLASATISGNSEMYRPYIEAIQNMQKQFDM